MRYLLPVLLVSSLFTSAMAQTTLYITDATKFAVRSGKSNQHKILRMVPSGTAVTVLEKTDDGYARVRAPQGTEGWILLRYLDAVPSARDRLQVLQSGYDELKAQSTRLEEQLQALETTHRATRAQPGSSAAQRKPATGAGEGRAGRSQTHGDRKTEQVPAAAAQRGA
jgi:SH3 domain protein